MEQSPSLRHTHAKDGGLQIIVSDENLPQFLVEAKIAIERGRIAEAADLLNGQAIDVVRRMLQENPSRTDIMFMLGLMLYKIGRWHEAEEWYKQILKTEQHALVFHELGRLCRRMGRLTEARQYRKRAVEADPDNTGTLTTYALDLIRTGETQKGIDILREVIEKEPNNVDARSKLLFHLHYLPNLDPQVVFEEHKRWGLMHAPVSRAKVSHDNDPDPDRRLRIGYISPDFRMHSVAYNFEAFLSGRDRQAVEVYGYGNIAKPDSMTRHLEQQFDHYRNIRGLNDEVVVSMIEGDKIDVLVEIGGHIGDNRLLVMAYKPAPVLVDYGGINTSGMEQIDYRFTDSLLDSPQTQEFYTEESVYLPGGLFCYSPPDFSPPLAPPPAIRRGYVTFGSFNNNMKIHPHIVSLWAQVLRANNDSRLLLKFIGGNDRELRNHYFSQFEQSGIERARVEIHGWKSSVEHLRLYAEMDIALDTYPYNGCLTTLEGLWMGVPIVSLVGKHSFLSRAGLSILSRLDMDSFAASTPEDYIAKATALASNLDALVKIRSSMRQRMAASVLCDAKAYASSVEAAYRQMWRKWCDRQFRSDAQNTGDDTPVCSATLIEETANLSEEK